MRKLALVFLMGLTIIFSMPVATVTVTDLYSALVPLVERADSKLALNETFRRALTQVLIKLTGRRNETMEALRRMKLLKPEEWVQQYEYQTDAQGKRMILVTFDEAEVDDLIEELDLPRWSNSRPSLLAWIVINRNNQALTINESEYADEADVLMTQAKQRGIPLLFPLFDLEDQITLKTTVVENGEEAAIKTAISRYKTETTLIGWVFEKEGQWEGRWRLLMPEKAQSWQDKRLTLPELLNEAMNRSIDTIAQQFITKDTATEVAASTDNSVTRATTHSQAIEVTVKNVPNFAEYTRLKAYLQSLGIVTQLQPQSIQTGEVTFQLMVKGGQTAFEQAVNLGNTLKPLTHTKSHLLTYYLQSP